MDKLSPLARTYKEAFEGRMIVFDMDGTHSMPKLMDRNAVVVLDGHTCHSTNQKT